MTGRAFAPEVELQVAAFLWATGRLAAHARERSGGDGTAARLAAAVVAFAAAPEGSAAVADLALLAGAALQPGADAARTRAAVAAWFDSPPPGIDPDDPRVVNWRDRADMK